MNSNGIYPVGTIITYRCQSGFQISNLEVENICLENGAWSLSVAPPCIGK